MKSFSFSGSKHIMVVLLFLIISLAYFSPLLEGKKIQANDDIHYLGISKEIRDFREKYETEPLWTNSLFGGMPAYQISRVYKGNIFETINKKILILPKPALFMFTTLAGFYLMLLLFGVEWKISTFGAIAFAFSSYFLVIIAAGHNAKAAAIAYMPPMIGGLFYIYRKKVIPGLIVYSIAFGMQLAVNNVQITYYTFIIALLMAGFVLVEDIRNKQIVSFIKKSSLIILISIVVFGTDFSNLYFTYDYGKDSTRGEPEVTLNSEGNTTTGLDKDYALQWSYGIDETLTLLIPNFKGGVSGGELPEKSESFKLFKEAKGTSYARKVIKQMPTYWGTQPFTQGTVYIGASIIFLFVLSLFVYKGWLKWWLVIITIVSIMLAWGKNFAWLSHLFLDYFPGYNKFRAVTMTLVMTEFTIPLLAFLGFNEIVKGKIEKTLLLKYLKYSLFIVGGICLVFVLFPGAFYNFEAPGDVRYLQQPGGERLVDAFQADRQMLLRDDAIRSLIFVLIVALFIYLYVQKKIKNNLFYVLMAIFILIDLWAVDKRYTNNDLFVKKREIENPITPTKADLFILNDKEPDFRVLNLTTSPFQDAITSYFHKSIGGYHGAKLKRYQNLIDYELTENISALATSFQNPSTIDSTLFHLNGINMLNTKYIIYNKESSPLANPYRFGEAWVVDDIKYVDNPNEELLSLKSTPLRKTAIVNKSNKENIKQFDRDSTAKIQMVSYQPNHLVYEFNSEKEVFVVFSEIYYPKGWNAFIDGEPTDYFRADFLLRAMWVPKGNHKIEFSFKPEPYFIGERISRASSLILLLLVLGSITFSIRNKLKAGEKRVVTRHT